MNQFHQKYLSARREVLRLEKRQSMLRKELAAMLSPEAVAHLEQLKAVKARLAEARKEEVRWRG